MIDGHAVTGVAELADGAGVSVAISDARTGAAKTLEADWFIDATGGKVRSIAKDPRFSRELTQGPMKLLPRERPFAVVQSKADETRGMSWTGPGGAFAINDKVEGVLSAYRPMAPKPAEAFGTPDIRRLYRDLEIPVGTEHGAPRTFTARQSIAPHAAQGRILLTGDSVGTVMPATQAGTMLALTDAERAANAVIRAHGADTAERAAAVIDDYDRTTIAMHNVFIR